MDKEFLKIVLPENDGWFYVVRITEPKSAGDERPKHTAVQVKTPHRGDWVIPKYNSTHGIFFTHFTFTVDYKENSEGQPRNVRKLPEYKLTSRCFVIDLDIGPEPGKYATKEEALKALLSLSGPGKGMPHPTFLVDSGGGLHGYWVVDNALHLPDWQRGADRFKQFWINAGLKFDHVCTDDSSRVMRLPGSDNMKTGSPRPCKRLDYTGPITSTQYIERWPEPVVSTVETIPALFSDEGSEDHLTEGQTFGPKYTSEIVKRCNVFKHIAADRGASCSEQLWKDVLQTVKLTEDVDEWAHKLSDGHSDYSHASTEEKLAERTFNKGQPL